MHMVEAVLAESAVVCPRACRADLVARGVLQVHAPESADHSRMAQLFHPYRDLDPGWADLALVRLAELRGVGCVTTLETTDFTAHRIHGSAGFQLEFLR